MSCRSCYQNYEPTWPPSNYGWPDSNEEFEAWLDEMITKKIKEENENE